MLAKLLKYEIKATARNFLPLYAVLLLFAGVNRVLLLFQDRSPVLKYVFTLSIVVFALIILLIFVLTLIVMIQRFYKNLLGDEGYLMLTLPAKVWQHIAAKLIVSILWIIVDLIFTAASILLVASRPHLFEIIRAGFHTIGSELAAAGFDVRMFLIYFAVVSVVSLVSSILMIYASLAIGHQFSRHRVLASFGAFIGFYMAMQAVGTAFVVVVLGANMLTQELTQGLMNLTLGYSTGLSLVCAVGYIHLTNYLLSRRLNLE